MTRVAVTVDRKTPPGGPFSPAIWAGDLLYLSGQVGEDWDTGGLVSADIAEQTAQILRNIASVLKSAGKTMGDVVKVNVYLTDIKNFAAMNEVYARHFEAPYPARTTVAVVALPIGALVEMEVVAR